MSPLDQRWENFGAHSLFFFFLSKIVHLLIRTIVLGYNYYYDYFNEHTGRVAYAKNIQDGSLDRSYEYDDVGRLAISHSGAEARAATGQGPWNIMDGPYSQGYEYDVWGAHNGICWKPMRAIAFGFQ